MDTQASSSHLDAVAHEVVCLGANLFWMLVEQWYIVRVRHGERVVCSHESLLLVAPFEQREIDNPETFKLVLVAKSETIAHFKSQGAELCASFVGLFAAEYEYEVAILCAHLLFYLQELFGSVELVDA